MPTDHTIDVRVEPLDPLDAEGISVVARRMRDTLVEVLGEARGADMYSHEWLVQRVQYHLDPALCTGAVFVARSDDSIVGHTIVREESEDGITLGLFSTTQVMPGARGGGVASRLLDAGEAWMRAQGLPTAVTYTEPGNKALISLYKARGYEGTQVSDDFVRLSREL